jgi:hypothetical protein
MKRIGNIQRTVDRSRANRMKSLLLASMATDRRPRVSDLVASEPTREQVAPALRVALSNQRRRHVFRDQSDRTHWHPPSNTSAAARTATCSPESPGNELARALVLTRSREDRRSPYESLPAFAPRAGALSPVAGQRARTVTSASTEWALERGPAPRRWFVRAASLWRSALVRRASCPAGRERPTEDRSRLRVPADESVETTATPPPEPLSLAGPYELPYERRYERAPKWTLCLRPSRAGPRRGPSWSDIPRRIVRVTPTGASFRFASANLDASRRAPSRTAHRSVAALSTRAR